MDKNTTFNPARELQNPVYERYAQLRHKGHSKCQAWKESHQIAVDRPSTNLTRAAKKAEDHHPEIVARIKYLFEASKPPESKVLSKDEKRELIAAKVRSGELKASDFFRAIELDAKISGDMAPVKIDERSLQVVAGQGLGLDKQEFQKRLSAARRLKQNQLLNGGEAIDVVSTDTTTTTVLES